MHFQQVRLSIDMLVQRVRSGRLALPDFQRDFVWTPSQISELLDTIARQWPMGSLLLLNGNKLFEAREIDGAPKLNSNGPDLYLLDGQQRVTSLFHAVTNSSKYCYFVDFNDLSEDSGEIVNWMSRVVFEKTYGTLQERASKGIALVKDIWDASSFFEWVGHVRSNEDRLIYMKMRDEKLAGFHSNVYQVMAIELEEGIGLEALARIFETINRTGVALNAFDLLVAKLYPSKFMLRDMWDKALRENPILRHFEPNEFEIMKMVSLLIRRDYGPKASKGVRQGDVLNLKVGHIIDKWDEAVHLYVAGLKRISTFGVVCKELVPSWSMVLGLAGCEIWLDDKRTFSWWRDAIAKQSFAQSANTKIVSEFDSQMKNESPGQEEDLTAKDLLRKSIRANGLLAKGFASLMVRKEARDPISGRLLLTCSSVLIKTIGDDGVLLNVKAADTIKNMILISGESDERVVGKSLADGPQWKTALLSQGIDSVTGVRDYLYVKKVFEGGIV